MNPIELIKQKRNGITLPKEDLKDFIQGYLTGSIPDYQMAALLMAIYFNGMDDEEIFSFVEIMINSGEKMDFSHVGTYVADKHSTGGVGDKVSIILGPLMAAIGLAIPMISGRSLGHTGGTLDKLETIPGFCVDISLEKFRQLVDTTGIAMIGQTDEICPADKKMYALRDVTGTVESIPLICGSIMSKKIAEGIQGLVLDVKSGNGAFMKTLGDAKKLGKMLKRIGNAFGVSTTVVYSSMDQPLGRFAGLWCEVRESIEGLRGNGPEDTMALTFELGARLILQAGLTNTHEKAIALQKSVIESGKAYRKFLEMVTAQGGNQRDIENYKNLHLPKFKAEQKANRSGIITFMDTYNIGMATVELGCGRLKISDMLDPTAGIEFIHKLGDYVEEDEVLIRCFNSDKEKLNQAFARLSKTIRIGDQPVKHTLIL